MRWRRTALAAAVALGVAVAGGAAPEPMATAAEEPITPIPPDPWQDEAAVALGRRLFDDPRLSGSGALSCASCHDLATNGASARPRDVGASGGELPFNTPTVFNAALSFRFGWEGRFRDLRRHAVGLIENPGIMASTLDGAVARLAADPGFETAFRAVYRRPVDGDGLLDALVAFERSLLTRGSRFDLWLAGDAGALTTEERAGYELFKSMGCVSCHQGVGIGGNLFQRQGVYSPLVASPPQVVRVPSLRNVAATAPYFHDGSAATLPDAVRRMARAQLNAEVADADLARLVAFLGTLTGRYGDAPVRPAP